MLATVGLAPQIVSETLYALSVSADPPFVPTEIHVITTRPGAERMSAALLGAEGVLTAFAAEFDLPALTHALTPERIHVIASETGGGLHDINSDDDNIALADLITQIIGELTRDPACALHVSIAGGRKTMGFLAGAVLSMFARQQDRLSHVLVDPRFEQHPDFFYPPKTPRTLQDRAGNAISTAQANVTLAEIPFVRLRDGAPEQLVEGAWSYSRTVAQMQAGIAPPRLVVDEAGRRMRCGDTDLALPTQLLAFYAWLADCRRRNGSEQGRVQWMTADLEAFLAWYAALGASADMVAKLRDRLADPMLREQPKFFDQTRSKVNKALTDALGPGAEPYRIKSWRGVDGTRYAHVGLDLPPEAIRFAPLDDAGE
jgi:CRISPR-associated protein (TIGR02584 family)